MTICQLCKQEVTEDFLVPHEELESWLIREIKQAHPDWIETGNTCRKCIEYIRKISKHT